MEEFLIRVFRATAFDNCESIWWRVDGEYAPLTIFVICNDLFYWAFADCEKLTPENIWLFETSIADANLVDHEGSMWGPLLFCARSRGMRPQPPYYKDMPEAIQKLFNKCGPERDPKECG